MIREAEKKQIAVVLAGATGQTGQAVGRAVNQAKDMEVVGAIGQQHAGENLGTLWGDWRLSLVIAEHPDQIAHPDAVLVDFTEPISAYPRIMDAVERGWDVVVGTTGFNSTQREALRDMVQKTGVGAVLVANFSIGAYVLESLARHAAHYFSTVEIVEGHAATKRDRPSGTAYQMARTVGETLSQPPDTIPIHSLRLPGMVAHQAVIFGAEGEVITLRHDVHDRKAYVVGVLTAIRRVRSIRGRLVTDLGELVGGEGFL